MHDEEEEDEEQGEEDGEKKKLRRRRRKRISESCFSLRSMHGCARGFSHILLFVFFFFVVSSGVCVGVCVFSVKRLRARATPPPLSLSLSPPPHSACRCIEFASERIHRTNYAHNNGVR